MSAYSTERFLPSEYTKVSRMSREFFYRFTRYEAEFSMALFYSKEALDLKLFKNAMRESDKVVRLRDNLFLTIFDMSSEESGLKATANLLSSYETKHYSQKLYISFASTQTYPNEDMMKSHLFSFLNYSIEKKRYNEITDDFFNLESISA